MTRWLRRPAVGDSTFLFVLCTTALAGFHDVFDGWTFLFVGVAGLVLGIALGLIVARLGQPVIVLAVLVTVAFFLFGGLFAFHALGGSYLLPVPRTLGQLATVSVHGWKDLVTTVPPIDDGPLLTIPYLIGLVGGGAGMAVAKRARPSAAPLVVPFAVLAAVISLGVKNPTHATVLAGVFVAVVIGWAVERSRRGRLQVTNAHARRLPRSMLAAALCAGAAVVAVVAGPHWPGRQPQREVFRAHVTPPLNVEQYPSPLVGFRRFTSGYKLTNPQDELYDKPLFEVTGLPAGSTIRLATLDSYDGSVWGAGNVAGTGVSTPDDPDTFQKVGHTITTSADGPPVSASVRILNGSALGVWVPVAGELTGLAFGGDRACGEHAYYNPVSATAVMSEGLEKCTRYSFSAVVTDSRFSAKSTLIAGSLPGVAAATQFQQTAAGIAGKAADPAATVKALADYLKTNGHKTDGEGDFSKYGAGHSLYRLQLFMSTQGQLAGDEEQFAAMLALLANNLSIPARVVVGVQALPNDDTVTVRGSDISAWVEVQSTDGTWIDVPAAMFMPRKPPEPQHPQPQTNKPAANIPPPAPVHPPGTAGQPFNDTLSHRHAPADSSIHGSGSSSMFLMYLCIPLAVVAAAAGTIVGLKRLRRTRRRTRGTPTRRLVGAWHELLDSARDYGYRAPDNATRREQATALGISGIAESARWADNTMFGSETPGSADVEAFWEHVDSVRKGISSSSSRWTRLRATFNVATLRPRKLQRA